MTEYGEKLVEAGAKASLVERFGEDAWILFKPPLGAPADQVSVVRRRADEARRDTRAALLAFLDKLIEEGPSGTMKAGATVANQRIGDGYLTDDELGQLFTVMLRTLRAEIAAPDQAREGAR